MEKMCMKPACVCSYDNSGKDTAPHPHKVAVGQWKGGQPQIRKLRVRFLPRSVLEQDTEPPAPPPVEGWHQSSAAEPPDCRGADCKAPWAFYKRREVLYKCLPRQITHHLSPHWTAAQTSRTGSCPLISSSREILDLSSPEVKESDLFPEDQC